VTPALLALEDGSLFHGEAIGVSGRTAGEVVFNTAMTGYQEIITDPSYARQIVTLTYPHIGNTGINPEDMESGGVYAAGLVIRDLPALMSNFRAAESLPEFMRRHKLVGIAGIDTRRLTRLLREKGAQNGCIVAAEKGGRIDKKAALAAARAFPGLKGMDLAQVVSTKKPYAWDEGDYIRQFILVNSGLSYALPLAESKHHHSVLRYVVGYFFYGMMPWSIFLIAFSYRFFSKRLWRENKQLLFPAAWLSVMSLIFFLMGQKRSTYLLPLYPPAALLIAVWWDGVMERSPNISRGVLQYAPTVWLLRGLGGLLVIVLGSEIVWVCQGISSRAMIVVGFTVFSIFVLGAFLVYSGRFKELFIFLFLIAVSTGVSYNQIFLPGEKKDVLRKIFYEELNSSLGTCTTLGVYGYGLDYKELLFYSKRRLKRVNSASELEEFFRSEGKVYCLMVEGDYSLLSPKVDMRLVREFPGKGLFLVSNK